VYQNTRIISGISFANIAWAFSHLHADNWHPLTTITHMLDCQLHGLSAGWHHLTNVLLHCLAVVLLFLALERMTGALWRSAFVSAIFAVHPLHVESVAWIAERKDVLSAVFFMLTLLTYLYYTRAPSLGSYLIVAVAMALGLMSKPMLVTLPFVLLLLDYWPLRRFQGDTRLRTYQLLRFTLEKTPLMALSAASSIVTFLAQRTAIGWTEQLPVAERVSNAVVAYAVYIRQMLWPTGLAVFYPHPENRLPVGAVCLALSLIVGFTVVAFIFRNKAPYLVTGWLWYVGMLVPVIGILQVGWQGHADRYTYLPQIGLYIALTWAVTDLTRSWRVQRIALGTAAAVVLGSLSCCAWLQTSYWRDSETLFTHALAVTSNNDVALNNLGIIYLDKGQLDEAIAKLQTAIDLRPENAPAQDNLAKALLRKGRVNEAMVHYRKFLELEPANVEVRNTLGTALIQQGHVLEAIRQWQEVLTIQPLNGNAASNLAWVFATSSEASIRDGTRAVELAERAFRLSGGKIPMIYRVLAAAYAETGRFAEAAEIAQRGADLARAHGNSALAAELESSIINYQAGRPQRDPSITDASP
jgi:protein O-mannosyl-transferase